MDKGLKILLATYWSGGTWNRNIPTAAEFELAKAEGYLFDPAPMRSHDETLRDIQAVLNKISPDAVRNAFLYSLSTRHLQYRSALGSYYYALAIPDHSHMEAKGCYLCNWLPGTALSEKNLLNFERYKWGGIRHTSPEYVLFDLEQFLRLPPVTPTEEDWMILKSLLHAMDELPPNKKAGAYRQQITKKKILKSNKDEVEVLLDILGICGVLSGANAPCYCERFVDVWQRAPQEHTNDYHYPLNHWHISDGVNEERFRKVFGVDYSNL